MGFKVFILEDDLSFRSVLELRLKSWRGDLELTFAETLKSAREILDQTTDFYPLVILDQRLPDGNGRDLLTHPALGNSSVLAVSSDTSPELPGEAVKAGAHHFLEKRQVTAELFIPLVEALVERSRLERELLSKKLHDSRMETVKRLIATLRHEINNPLGAVLGGAYLVRTSGELDPEQDQALKIIEASSNRIKHVIKQLCETAEVEEVTKANEKLFQVPGDPKW
jgi:signal transduction histidine kinase